MRRIISSAAFFEPVLSLSQWDRDGNKQCGSKVNKKSARNGNKRNYFERSEREMGIRGIDEEISIHKRLIGGVF